MNLLFTRLFFLILIIFGTSSFVYSYKSISPTSFERLLETYIELVGIREKLEPMQSLLNKQFSEMYKNVDRSDLPESVEEFYNSQLDLDWVIGKYKIYLRNNTNEELIQEFITWMKNPLLHRVERDLNAKFDSEEIKQYVSDLELKPLSEERFLLIRELEEILNLTEYLENMMLASFSGISKPYREELLKDARNIDRVREIDSGMMEIRTKLNKLLYQSVILRISYAFRDCSNDELREYINLFKSDIAKKYVEITHEGIIKIVEHWYVEAAKNAAAEMKQNSGNNRTRKIPIKKSRKSGIEKSKIYLRVDESLLR